MNSKGTVLVLCLLMLFALTLLGLAAASDQVLQARMSSNQIIGSQSSQSADITLDWAEDWLFGLEGTEKPGVCSDSCLSSEIVHQKRSFNDDAALHNLAWWEKNAHPTGKDPQTGIILDQALVETYPDNYWLIKEAYSEPALPNDDKISEITYYRILARASSGHGALFIVSESIIARPWGDVSLRDAFPAALDQAGFCLAVDDTIPCGRLAWRQIH